jgi:putative transposase
MPFNETNRMDERCRFALAYLSGQYEMSELCSSYGISRPTGYKWVGRYLQGGPLGLQERSRAPHSCPHRMSEEVAQWFLAARRKHPRWGPRKLLKRFKDSFPRRTSPSRSAVAALLKRAGLSQPRRRRSRKGVLGRRAVRVYQPNELWTIDFKGHFRTTDHRWCYPLTLMDYASRYLVGCQAYLQIDTGGVQRAMQRLFHEYGLPEAIHSDNGAPFASTGIAGLSHLSVQWLKLGIRLHRSRPGCPQDNGAHERMHRTLKAETARPPAGNLRAQQRRFARFRAEYNHERPHEALADQSPAKLFRPSPRQYPSKLPEPQYPGHFEVRRVAENGCIKWNGKFVFIGAALRAEWLGLEEIDNGLWSIRFMEHLLARFDARTMALIDVPV